MTKTSDGEASVTAKLKEHKLDAIYSMSALRDRLWTEIVGLQDGEIPIQRALAVAALTRQLLQTTESQIGRIDREERRLLRSSSEIELEEVI